MHRLTHRRKIDVNGKRRGWSSISSSSYVLCFLLLISVQSSVISGVTGLWTATSLNLQVTDFIDEETLGECRMNLEASDANSDGKLSSDEFLSFLVLQSNGSIDAADFVSAPLRLIILFHWTACMCSLDLSQEEDCCVGSEAHIDLEDDGSDDFASYMVVFCAEIERGIDQVTNTPAPSLPPSDSPPPIPSPTVVSTGSPSSSPTVLESSSPTSTPSPSPSRIPTIETPAPTIDGLFSVVFQYGITNSANLTAEDILDENDNTLKRGLLVATRNVTIEILNATFPYLLQTQQAPPSGEWVASSQYSSIDLSLSPHVDLSDTSSPPHGADYEKYGPSNGNKRSRGLSLILGATEHAVSERLSADHESSRRAHLILKGVYGANPRILQKSGRRGEQTLATRSVGPLRGSPRRLVFYTDDSPVEIPSIIDNPNCPSNDPLTRCAIVSTRVNLVLQEGDDPVAVRQVLIDGFKLSFMNGDFEAAIPPQDNFFP